MNSDKIVIKYKQIKTNSLRALSTGVLSAAICILINIVNERYVHSSLLMGAQVILLLISISMFIVLLFIFRCPYCGIFLGARYRLFHKSGWQMFPSKTCWNCHINLLTGEHEKDE